MKSKTAFAFGLACVLASGVVGVSAARGQDAALAEQLKAQYKLCKVGLDASGWSVTEPGTVLTIQKGGILAVPPANPTMAPATYKDGDLKSPNAAAKMFLGNSTRFLTVGEKVYVFKIDVHVKNDKVTLTIIECDSCNGVQQPSTYKSQVAFQFPKDYLAKADSAQVKDVINQVLSVDAGGSDAQQQPAQQQAPATQEQQAAPEAAEAPAPATIEAGQTIDQVKAILGQPEKIVKIGTKQIYVYKDLKITFIDGKVTEVQ